MPAKRETLIWERMQTGRTARRLDYGAIIRATTWLADREGIEAVSMRHVAAALDAGTMSLYRYVSGKDDLLDLVLDAAYGEIPLPARAGADWIERIRRIAIDTRRVMRSHPWLASLVSRRPTLGPNYLSWFESLLEATAVSGRSLPVRVRMIGTVWAYLSGAIAYELGERETDRRHKLTAAKKRRIAQPYIARLIGGGLHPHLAEFFTAGLGQQNEARQQEAFLAGLDAVLRGIQTMGS